MAAGSWLRALFLQLLDPMLLIIERRGGEGERGADLHVGQRDDDALLRSLWFDVAVDAAVTTGVGGFTRELTGTMAAPDMSSFGLQETMRDPYGARSLRWISERRARFARAAFLLVGLPNDAGLFR